MTEKPLDPVPSVAELIVRHGFDGAAWELLADAYRALRSYVPAEAGLMLEIRELLQRRTARIGAPPPGGYGNIARARAQASAESALRIAERRLQEGDTPTIFPPEDEETRSRVHAIAPTFDGAPAPDPAPGPSAPPDDGPRPPVETRPSLEERVQTMEKRLERLTGVVCDCDDRLADAEREIAVIHRDRPLRG